MHELKAGEWYDGFVWRNGRQQGVWTMRWDIDVAAFTNYKATYPLYDGLIGKGTTFEPNVISIGEPAS